MSARRGLALSALLAAVCGGGPTRAQCNWEADALANVTGGTHGVVVSSHFGEITRVTCINSRNVVIRAQTLLDGTIAHSYDKVGPAAVLGAYVTYDKEFNTCEGGWRATTRAGTRYLGIDDWLDDAVSGIRYASCPPPGGGGPGQCGGGFGDTSTLVVGAGGAQRADRQLGFRLSRFDERPEGHFLFDEWALLAFRSDETLIRLSSSTAFKERVAAAAGAYRDAGRRTGAAATAQARSVRGAGTRPSFVLVVEAANHPHDSRHIPMPEVAPIEVDLGWAAKGHAAAQGEFWFRAEVAATGEVDRLLILERPALIAEEDLQAALRGNLELRYAGDKRHRVVVFGRAEVSASGRLSMKAAVPVTPLCCCTFNPEGPRCY